MVAFYVLFRERIEKRAPSIIERDSINQAVETGQLVIDSLFPIGRGQRQLIIGDKKTGKTTIALDLILSQQVNRNNLFLNLKKNLFAILVSVGQKQADVLNILLFFEFYFLQNTTSIVLASASSAAPLQYIAPFVGCTLGEFFRNNGLSAVAVYDDLSKHAIAYRQLALLLRRPPGREAFPSDIFYLHARLLERAGRLSAKYSGGSLTAFPVVETQAGDISAYIPTNIISITDGQLFLDYELFSKGHRPAIHTGLSVSRIGSSAQSKIMKQAVGPFKLLVAQLKQLERFESFASDLDQSIRNDILRGKVLTSFLKQFQHVVYPILNQVFLISFSINLELDDLDGLVAADYGFYFKDLVRFIFSDKHAFINFNIKSGFVQYSNVLVQRRVCKFLSLINKFKLKIKKIKELNFKRKFKFKILKKLKLLVKFTFVKNFWLIFNLNDKKNKGFLFNQVISLSNDKINEINNQFNELLYGIYYSPIILTEYSFNYWTSTFFYPFFVSLNFIFNRISDVLFFTEIGANSSNSYLSILYQDNFVSDLIAPLINVNDLDFYQDIVNLEFIVELLSFAGFENFLENKINTQLILLYFNDLII